VGGESDDYVTATEARLRLGISKQKLAALMRDGVLPSIDSVMDKRVKLVRRADVERLAQQPRPKPRRPPPLAGQ
jgi:hypothetical protein